MALKQNTNVTLEPALSQSAHSFKPVVPRLPASIFEGMFVRALQPTGAFLEALRETGFDPVAMEATYSVEVWTACLTIARRQVYPSLSEEAGDRALGRRFADGFLSTIVGRMVAVTLPIIGLARMLDRLPRYVSMGRSDLVIQTAKVGETQRKLTFINGTPMPHFMAGALETAFNRTRTVTQVAVTQVRKHQYEIFVGW